MGPNKKGDYEEGKQSAPEQKISPEANQSDPSDSFFPQPEISLPQEKHSSQTKQFPIVGVGASAGGLEAFERFFTGLTPDSGMAFVLVQHLDPTHESMLVDLLKRYTRMPVGQVKDGLPVEPNHVYVIPPNRDMALLQGALYLMEPVAARGLHLPIDFFFRSLAEDQADRAICIILSGTGTDGTLGLKAIKGEGGLVRVQEPASARYDGMPRSAMATGLVDYVLPPEQMPEQLIQYVNHAVFKTGGGRNIPLPSQGADWLQKIFILLRGQIGHDFSRYKPNTISRRVERRMMVNQVEQVTDYIRFLQQSPLEVEALFRELLIGVTNFFRDPEAFQMLQQKVIPRLFAEQDPDRPIRIWVPSCSTGEEAYSIAMLVQEQPAAGQVQVFATDIDKQAIEKARLGLYPASIAADVSPERLQRFFVKEGNLYQVGKQIRDIVIFAEQSIIKDPPFSRLDLISCRNLLIYLASDLQRQVIPLFHYALKPTGFLFLGPSEGVGKFTNLFRPIDRRWKLFQRAVGEVAQRASLDFPALPLGRDHLFSSTGEVNKTVTIRQLTEKLLLENYSAEEVRGRKPNLLKSGRQTAEIYGHLWETILAGQDWRGELCNRKKNGELYWVSTSISPVENAAGQITHFIAVQEDVTDRKQTEAALRESEAFLQDIYAGLNAAVYVIEVTETREFRYQSVNPAFERLTGRTNEMVRGKRLEEWEPPLNRESVATANIHCRRCVETGRAFEAEQKAPAREPESWWQVRLEPLQNEGGDVYRIIGTGAPITRRNRAEQALWRAGRLFEALGRWQQVLVGPAGGPPALAEMCRLLVEVGGYRLAWVGRAGPEGTERVKPVARAGYSEDALIVTGLRTGWEQGPGPLETAMRTNQPAVMRSIEADPAYAPWREEASKYGYRSSLFLPWVTEDDTPGLLNLYAAEPDAFDEAEIDLLRKLTDNLSEGLRFLRRRVD